MIFLIPSMEMSRVTTPSGALGSPPGPMKGRE